VHCLSIHQWSLEKDAPASLAAIDAQKKRVAELAQKRRKTHRGMSTAGAELQKQVGGELASSDSDVSISVTISDEDIEPSDVDGGKPPVSKTSVQQSKMTIIDWSLTKTAVSVLVGCLQKTQYRLRF